MPCLTTARSAKNPQCHLKSQHSLQSRRVKDLHVDNQLITVVTDDQNADRATAGVKGLAESGPEIRLVDDGEAGFDVASLGHGCQSTVMHIQHTILLENRSQHSLNNNVRAGFGDKARILMQLLAE